MPRKLGSVALILSLLSLCSCASYDKYVIEVESDPSGADIYDAPAEALLKDKRGTTPYRKVEPSMNAAYFEGEVISCRKHGYYDSPLANVEDIEIREVVGDTMTIKVFCKLSPINKALHPDVDKAAQQARTQSKLARIKAYDDQLARDRQTAKENNDLFGKLVAGTAGAVIIGTSGLDSASQATIGIAAAQDIANGTTNNLSSLDTSKAGLHKGKGGATAASGAGTPFSFTCDDGGHYSNTVPAGVTGDCIGVYKNYAEVFSCNYIDQMQAAAAKFDACQK